MKLSTHGLAPAPHYSSDSNFENTWAATMSAPGATLLKPVLVAALGCLVLYGCGTQKGTSEQAPAGSAVGAQPQDPSSPGGDQEMRFLALMTRTAQGCTPDAPNPTGGGGVPKPEDLPGAEAVPTPRYGPGQTPPGVPNADGDIPVPLDDPAPPAKPAAGSTGSGPVGEVPLTGVEECVAGEHVKRVGDAFKNKGTTGHEAMHKQLTDLDYPAARIHRMPDHAGAPRMRIDLRTMGGHLALEVTASGSGAVAEAFGAPETEDVEVADVTRGPSPDAPAS
ncbi:hypothetical protein [Streptomyces erythrochromogenes]|uniref:hypothetical protein n=1 Tax=Streptomyces erythrochromogenes TaxID=285574 RepID=UPI00225C399B|nr:hypothetical protein [Streptomyces erythrochromogenes]MCX5583374.1 hypothetical protein [Streptomyces erythrochromogenes]